MIIGLENGVFHIGLLKFKNGIEKQYEKEKDITYTGNVGNEIYTIPIPEIMERNTEMININGVNYKMGSMLRVNPRKIRVSELNYNIWVVNGILKEIRPYGILLKKIE